MVKKMRKKKTRKKKISKKENKTKGKITAKMTFNEVIQKYPETSSLFFKYGLSCIGCPLAMQETIEQGCKAHGIDVGKLVDELNKKIKKK